MVPERGEDEGRSRLMLIVDILSRTYIHSKSSELPCEAGAVLIPSFLHEETEAQRLCNCVKVTRPGNAEPGGNPVCAPSPDAVLSPARP